MKFAIIGTNFVSEFFMDGAKQVDECEVIAVCGTSIEKANVFADKYDIKYRFDNYKDLLESKGMDAVYIAVPNGLHKELTCAFLEKEIPVFCEKPMGSNIDEVKEMIELAKSRNTYLQEGLIPLYNPNFKVLKENLYKVGKIHQVTFNFSKYSSRYDAYLRKENPTTFRADLSNGAIMDLGVYIFADCIGLFGKPKQVFSSCELLETKADVSGASIFVYDDFIATLSYSKASDTQNKCEICGELGTLILDQPSQPQVITFVDRLTKEEICLSSKPKENFAYEIQTMIDSIKMGHIENECCPHDTSLAIHEVLSKCRKMAGVHFLADK